MLIDIGTGRPIRRFPFKKDFDLLRARLTAAEFDTAVAEINNRIEAAGGDVATAGWLPGRHWENTPFNPIYLKGARQDEVMAARLFGLLVWHTINERPERWASGRYEKDGKDIGSRTYFRIR